MLCRVADSLFWMSRYIERAEDTARLADVNLQLLLELGLDEAGAEAHWLAIFESLGDRALFEKSYGKLTTRNAIEFLTFSQHNPSSVLCCVLAARENARMIRDQISSEMWEVINRLYLFMRAQDRNEVMSSGASEFFKQIKEWSHLFNGVTDATFPRQVGYEFIKIGCYLERADKTARIINAKQYLEGDHFNQGSAQDMIQWVAILSSCTALEAYQRIYVDDILPRNVVDFLIHSKDFPHSLLFCLSELQLAIHDISKCPVSHYSNEAERILGKLISNIVYTSVEEIIAQGIHEYLEHVLEEVSKVTLLLSEQYMFMPVVDPAKEAEEASTS